MDDPLKVDLAIVARDFKLPPEKIEKTVELLDAGNTIPFITRFRKDLTGGLDEQQILAIKQRVAQLRALAERKTFVLKSIESQGKLTDELKTQINKSSTSRRLEDYYLPFKPKKQSRASLARQQGLEPLAEDIFSGASPDIDLATRSTEFVRVDKGLNSVDDVIKGVGDLLAERFSENDELRSTLRKIMWNDGKLEAQLIETADSPSDTANPDPKPETEPTATNQPADEKATDETSVSQQAKLPAAGSTVAADVAPLVEVKTVESIDETQKSQQPEVTSDSPGEDATTPIADAPAESTAASAPPAAAPSEPPTKADGEPAASVPSPSVESAAPNEIPPVTQEPVAETTDDKTGPGANTDASQPAASSTPDALATPASGEPSASPTSESKPTDEPGQPASPPASEKPVVKTKKKKKKKKKKVEDPFNDYRDFKQPLKQIPNHRILAINRGERAGNLKVKIKVDGDKLAEAAFAALVPPDHPSSEFLKKCANDALNRMIIPSLEREIRRELTEVAEKHAVEVFANNLRNLLLQPPIRNRVVLAIDPGFKRGCSVAVLDTCGNLLDSGHTFVVGNQNRRNESKEKIVNWVNTHNVDVIAIGNGAACRQTEQMVSDVIGEHLKDNQVQYVMVNEAGASIYSTSEIGREELPDAAPSIRSAVSIGRRLQDPLSELVKISPANIGVGMYQHDVKAKHLSVSLDDVVEFCVNHVGVNVNTASPSLLKYVSGLNALTARRVVEYRQTNGQFKNREELKQVSGFGDATFVQAAGFLRIHGGDRPLDCTSIHPESYEIANDILKRVETSIEELFPDDLIHPTPPSPRIVTKKLAPGDSNSDQPSASLSPEAAPVASAPISPVEPDVSPSTAAESSEPSLPAVPTESDSIQPDTAVTDSEATAPPNSETPSTGTEETPDTAASENVAPGGNTTANVAPTETAPTETAPAETAPAETAPAEAASGPTNPGRQPHSTDPAEKANKQAQSAKRKEILKKVSELDVEKLAADHQSGVLMVKDILMALKRPKWDPRDKTAKPIFRRGIIKADDLKPELQLDAQVVNVVDFGVFVDIGLGESSLVHVSQLSPHFIRDPHRLFAVGDVLKVWVSEVDIERRRVKLTAIRPGAKKPQGRRRSSTPEHGKSNPAAKSGNKYGGRPKGKHGGRPKFDKNTTRHHHARKPKPKPVKPITDGMLKGKEPMRSFSDLAQFVSNKPEQKKDNRKDDSSS